MYEPRVEIAPDGAFVFRNLPPIYVEALLCLPSILDENEATIEERLFPASYPDDAVKQDEWERYGKPELEALFETRRELIKKDLGGLVMEPVFKGFQLSVPESHRSAWLAGLNAARLMIGVRHDVDADDMERELDLDEPDGKEIGLLQIHLLGHLQSLIIEADES